MTQSAMDNALIEQQLAQAERHVAKDRRTSNASAKWSANLEHDRHDAKSARNCSFCFRRFISNPGKIVAGIGKDLTRHDWPSRLTASGLSPYNACCPLHEFDRAFSEHFV
jgi:hypothetical protein